MIPSVALGHPDDLFAVSDILSELLARVAEKRFCLFCYDGARLARRAVDLDDPVHLMATLVVLKRHGRTVFAPLEPRQIVRIGKERGVDEQLGFRGHVEDHRALDIQHVAGLCILERRVLWLELVFRRRLDVMHVTPIPWRDLVDGNPAGIGRPHERFRVVIPTLRTIRAQQRDAAAARFANRQVVVVDQRLELAVR
jgi:hypothetical protein